MNCLNCFAAQSAELALIHHAHKCVFRNLQSLLISISSNTEHIWFGDGADIYQVNGYLGENMSNVSELSLWSWFLHFYISCIQSWFHFFQSIDNTKTNNAADAAK